MRFSICARLTSPAYSWTVPAGPVLEFRIADFWIGESGWTGVCPKVISCSRTLSLIWFAFHGENGKESGARNVHPATRAAFPRRLEGTPSARENKKGGGREGTLAAARPAFTGTTLRWARSAIQCFLAVEEDSGVGAHRLEPHSLAHVDRLAAQFLIQGMKLKSSRHRALCRGGAAYRSLPRA